SPSALAGAWAATSGPTARARPEGPGLRAAVLRRPRPRVPPGDPARPTAAVVLGGSAAAASVEAALAAADSAAWAVVPAMAAAAAAAGNAALAVRKKEMPWKL